MSFTAPCLLSRAKREGSWFTSLFLLTISPKGRYDFGMDAQLCSDCKAYSAMDCFKGYCGGGEIVFADADSRQCQEYRRARKCKFCVLYSATDEFLGQCMGVSVYADRLAWNCENFTPKA